MADKTITQLTAYTGTPASTDEVPIWYTAGSATKKATIAQLGLALYPASPAQGDIIYYNGTAWVRLAAGTSGYFLKTNGAGANPSWAAGGAGSTPTGTGFVHVTAGVQDAAAALVTNADVDAAAAIAVTKLALGAANTVLSSDGATNTFSATPTVTGLTTMSHLTVGGAIKMDGGFSAITAGTNVLTLGSQTHFTGVAGSMPAAGTYTWAWGGTTYLTFSQSAAALSIAPASAAASVTIQQADNTTNSATGAATVLGAQTCTGTTSTGGALSLIAGYATATGGAALLRGGDAGTTGGDAIVAAGTGATNGAIKLNWGGSPYITYAKASTAITALTAASTTSLTHGYTDLGTNSATGGVMLVRAQTCTGTTSIGGDMRVGPGGGTSRPGQMYTAFGTTDVVLESFNSSAYVRTIDSSATSVTLNQTGASGAGTGALWSIAAQSRTSGTGGELRLGGGTGSGSSTHGAVTFTIGGTEVGRFDTSGVLNAKTYTGLSGNPFAYGVLNKTQTGGTTTLSSSEYCFHDIVISGTLASAGIIEFPATAGGSWTITNSCAGAYALAIRCTGGSRLTYIGRNQSVTVRCDGFDLWAINDKPAIGTLAEGIIDYTGAISTNTDTTIYTVQSQATTLITGIELYLEPAQVGAGSSVTMTVGDTAGGTQWILSQTITTATTLGTVYGLDTTHLGSNFDATKGYVYYGNRASKSIIVRCARGAGGAVTAGSLRWRVLGAVTG